MTRFLLLTALLLIITASLSSGSFLVLLLYDEKFVLTTNIFTFSSTLFSALLGGYIAYFASKKQISANSDNEQIKELKKETTGCLVAKTELETLLNRLENTKSSTKYRELAPFIEITYLETFRQEFLYLFDTEEINKFLRILNRIKLIKLDNSEKQVDETRLLKLIEDCRGFLQHFEDLYNLLYSLRNSIRNK
jgi:hypothetical protein